MRRIQVNINSLVISGTILEGSLFFSKLNALIVRQIPTYREIIFLLSATRWGMLLIKLLLVLILFPIFLLVLRSYHLPLPIVLAIYFGIIILGAIKGGITARATRGLPPKPGEQKFYLLRAQCHYKYGLYSKAIDDYTCAISGAPENGILYLERAKAYERLGENVLADNDKQIVKRLGLE